MKTWGSAFLLVTNDKSCFGASLFPLSNVFVVTFLLTSLRKGYFLRRWLRRYRFLMAEIAVFMGFFIFGQDQDSLLVKRRNDNHSPGPVIRELVPSNTILCIFSRWDQRIGEGIPIPDSLGEEATLINICISNESLKCHRVLISSTPSFGDKVICWYTGFTSKTFI